MGVPTVMSGAKHRTLLRSLILPASFQSTSFSKNSLNKNFGGLGVNAKGYDTSDFIDDVPRHFFWWAVIGAYKYHGGVNTIPGPYDKKVKKVDMYVEHKEMCKSGWKSFKNMCYYFSSNKKTTTWNRADAECKSLLPQA